VDFDSDDDGNGEDAASLLTENGTSGWRSNDVSSRRHRRSGHASARNKGGLQEVSKPQFSVCLLNALYSSNFWAISLCATTAVRAHVTRSTPVQFRFPSHSFYEKLSITLLLPGLSNR